MLILWSVVFRGKIIFLHLNLFNVNIEQLYEIYREHPSVQTDTRKLKAGDLFFALKGLNFDGNAYAAAAIESGAALAVIDNAQYYTQPGKMMLVEDVLQTLQELAQYHRQQLHIPFVAITGTNGKTTTKELVNTVLSSTFKTVATVGNLNNHIGVPLTILSIPADTEIAVIEMGANHQLEIAAYCKIAMPTHGIITNIGKAHLEGFGGEEGVKKAKGELYDYLRTHNGTVFLFNEYDYLVTMSKGIPNIITYGNQEARYSGEVITGPAMLELKIDTKEGEMHIRTQLVGAYNFPNAMAAYAVGRYFKIPAGVIKGAIQGYTPSNNRSQIIQKGSNTIVMDAYNANPSSMKAAIENFAGLKAEKKVLLLGGMMELGEDSVKEHQALINLLERNHWEAVVLVGGDFANVQHPYLFLKNAEEARHWLEQRAFENAHLLIKGSRSVGMEKVI